MSEVKIQSIYIYPIKSLGGLALQNAKLEAEGLQYDRRYMLINEQNKFITQRTRPELTKFIVRISEGGFLIQERHLGNAKLLSHFPVLGDSLEVEIWDDHVMAREVLSGWSDFFSIHLGEKVRLVRLVDDGPRFISKKYQTIASSTSSFADSLPILLCAENSYKFLEDKMGCPIDWMRFRPNIIVNNTNVAFEEDDWFRIRVGEVELFGAKPCARCQLVNVNPADGLRDTDTLKALANFRKFGNKVYFGQQFVPNSLGNLRVGDTVNILETKHATY